MSHTAYIGIGSNMGDRRGNIDKAIELVGAIKEIEVAKTSSIYETDPVGGPPQRKFLNGTFEIRTSLSPFKLLKKLKGIERCLGRRRKIKNGPRTIDLDILLFGNEMINKKELKVPHPRMYRREFVLRGLRELERG